MTAAADPAFEPRVLAFCCNWCSYAGADLAGVSRLALPPAFHVIRVMCSARVAPEWVLKALDGGIDGVMVLGCHLGDCHYIDGNHRTAKRFALLAELLDVLGIGRDRLELEWVSASEGAKFQAVVTAFVDRIRGLGPVRSRPESAPRPKSLGRSPSACPAEAVLEDVRARAAKALADGDVAGVVGLRADGGRAVPHLFVDAREARSLVLTPHWPLATFTADVQRAYPLDRLATVVDASDVRALVEMAKLSQVDLDRLVLLGPDDEGAAQQDPRSADLQGLCLNDRRAFWEAEFERCIKCYGCRNACPVCLCDACVLEEQCWVPRGRVPPTLPFHWIRAWHVADRCVLCGACEAACPAEIPLTALHAQVHEKLALLFDYEPGQDVEQPSPLVTSLEEDPLREV